MAVSEIYPLTSSQREIWIDQVLREHSSMYNIGGYVRIGGAVDPVRFEQAINLLIRKHDCLRTVLVKGRGDDEVPMQMFAAQMPVSVPLHDFSTEPDPHASAMAWMQARFDEPFSLYGQPLSRHDLLKLGPNLFYWLLQYHHIIVDGWAIALLGRSLAEIYNTLQQGAAPDLTAHSYIEFIKDDRTYIVGETFKRQRTYWLEKYRSPPDSLLKPRHIDLGAEWIARSECRSLQLSRSFYDQLIALAKAHGATTFHVILAALYVYFVRTERREELVVGLPVLNRSNAAYKATAGLFVGVSAVRFDFGTQLSFAELLRSIGRVLKQDYRHQRFPVSELNRELLQRTGRQQLFDLRVSYEHHDHETLFGEAPGRTIALLNSYQPTPLTLFVREFDDADDVNLDFVYNLAYFQADDIDTIQRRLLGVLDAVVLDGEQPISRLPLLSEGERHQLLVQWNQTQREYPQDRWVHELFEEQAERTPDALALEHEGQQLTYGQLNAQANRLANYLSKLKVGADNRVALDLDRSASLVIAQLAILKCGSAYVPLDEDAPVARKAWMLSDCAARVVLSVQARELPRLPGLKRVNLDEIELSENAARSKKAPAIPRRTIDVAYVMYTSGSTGEPKGVQVTHQAISRLVLNNGYADFTATDRVAFAANPAFDASTLEVWAALLNGGCAVVVDRHSVLEPQRLRKALSERRISVLWLSVGLFNQMARVVPDAFGSLRYLIVGGDALDAKRIAQVLAAAPPRHLLNGYGPTETTTFATTYEIHEVAADAVSLPIGRPIANTRIYILDDHGEPVPIGVAGEIYIGGAGVARGYLNRPELTAERFVKDPFGTEPDARMYRTGDLGRYLPDGNIEFVGRNDAQVKIRGYRIELGEIEACLSAQPNVREAVVLATARDDVPGEKRLVAYVVSDQALDVSQLQERLSRELPEYMVPAAYVRLDALPLTANGKVDRKALPTPEGSAFAQSEYQAPQGELEQMLARLWSELLGVERIGRQDHFLRLGGHSLLAVQLMSRVRERLGIEISLQNLFARPVLSEFAHVVSQARRSGLPPLQAFDRPERLPLSYAQQRLWFIAQLDKEAAAAYHMPAGLRLRGHLDEDALKRALDRIVSRHEVLRTHFELVDGQPVQRIASADVGMEWQRQDLSSAKGEHERAELIRYWSEREANAPFDLARDALIRARLLQLAEQDHVLLLTMHHIVSDGWSISVLVRELSALYRAFSQRQADPLAPLKIQYADYALWQRQCLQERLDQQLMYWKQELQGAPELVSLPTDRTRPPVQDYRGECIEIALDAELSDQLHALSRRHGTTLHMVLLSAWAGLVGRLSGQHEVVIGTPVANRTEAQTEELIGFFVNTLALRVDLSGSPSVAELLERVRRCSLQGQSHQDVPYEQVVEVLKPTRALSHHPIFQLMFVWQNAPQEVLKLGELSVEWLPNRYHRAKFDLMLNLQQLGNRIVGQLEYASSLYERDTMQSHVRHLEAMLRGMVADESQSIERLPLLSQLERHQLLVEWNQTQRSHSQDRCIHELFQEQASRTPDMPALIYEDQQLTYAQLNVWANRLARYLRTLGVKPEVRVAILAERSVEMVVGVLATLKAGGAYVPLDPAYPVERLSYMLRDSGAGVLLVYADSASELCLQLRQSLRSGAPMVDMRVDAHRWCKYSGQNINRKQSPRQAHQLAYVIYTSGSTGEPKGVMVEHANVTRLFSATQQWFEFGRKDVWTLFHSFAFDFSVWEIWGALLYGGRLVVVPHLTSRSPQEFYELVCAERVTVLNQTPSAFRQFIAAQAHSNKEHRLRCVIFGGEALEVTMLKPWFQRANNTGVQLINMYGITETTVHVTYHRLQEQELAHVGASPIGRRIPDLRVYVLDQYGQPVPRGVSGEIYVGGRGVARGYLNRPELTAQRFVRDPFTVERDARMYRTGDLGRYLPDGGIEYLGRNDEQVKIRGYRIELGEIEAHLRAQTVVREAAIVLREDVPGEKRLVAYVVSESTELDVAQLREALSRELPEHMLPAAFVQIESLPLTANGKLDRKALPAPDRSAFAQREYEAPQGELEQVLAQIWSELLGVERIGRSDQFFELGGHSLLAVRLMERMRRAGLYAEIRTLFTQPTLSGFAQAVREAQQSGSREVEVPPNAIEAGCERITPSMLPLIDLTQAQIDQIVSHVPGGVSNLQDIYPLAPLQEGILFHHLLQQEGDPYLVMSMLSFDSRERLDGFVQALQSVIDRHDILRTAVLWEGLPEPVQVVWRRAPLAVEQITVEGIDDVAAHLRVCFDPAHYRIDVRIAPLLRVVTARDERNSRWLLLCLLHHLVDDNTSLKQLSKEIRAHLLGRVEELPAPIAFRSFVAQARLRVSKQEHEAFFRQMLSDVQEPTAPYGLQQVHGDGSDIIEERLILESSLSHRIRVQARSLGVSTASIHHFVWGLVLSRLSVRDDVVFGTVLFGRMQAGAGADRALGLFINTLPIRIWLGETGVAEGIRRTHESLAQLVNHEHASLVLAQRCSGVPAQVPLFSALLNYRHGLGESATEGQWVDGAEVLYTQERTNYPCVLSVDDLGSDFALTMKVVRPLSAQSVCRYVQQALREVVQALEQMPQTPAWCIGVLDDVERHQLLVQWNQTQREYPKDFCIHELFEEQVTRTPDAIALVCEEQHLSYGQLNKRANQLARYLSALGVGPEMRVAMFADRSLAMMVNVLAIMKSGAAYVPLDPAHPVERLIYMIRDSGAAVLLVQEESSGASLPLRQSLDAGVLIVDVRADAAHWARRSGKNINRHTTQVQPHHLAYVIYTSGSTGEPKGVMVEHRSVVNLWRAIEGLYRQRIDFPRMGVNAPLTFDSSVKQWVQLLSGSTLLIVSQSVRLEPRALLSFIEHNALNGIDCTPSQLKSWISAGLLEMPGSSLKTVLVGGEAIDTALWDQLARSFDVQFHNVYGPTECTVDTTVAHPADFLGLPNIGRPLPNVRVYLLDGRCQPVPLGVAGELYIGGAGVARGYLNRPELTAQRFVKDPFGAEPDARMYRTGDMGRYLPDGSIEYLGRNDQQVKVRGYRIELGEIEAHLRAQPEVRETVIVLREDVPGEKRLVAYIVSESAELDVAQLREALSRELPDHMLPAAFVQIDSLPLTANGKLDRKALPTPEQSDFVQREYEGPQGELEQALAQIWSELLGVERIGRSDQFFELGGHSLLAVQLIERMRQAGLLAEIRTLFTQPTLSGFAQAVRESRHSGWRQVEVPPNAIEAGCERIIPSMLPLIDLTQQQIDQIVSRVPGGISNIQDIYPLAPLQEGILFHHLLQHEGDPYLVMSMLSFDSRARLDGFVQALQSVIDRHDILRTAMQWEGLPEPVQVVWRQARVEVQTLSLQGVDIAEQLERHSDPAHYRLDIRQAPLLKGFAAFDERADRWLLRVVWHHLISDHSALEVLAQEVRLIQSGQQQLLSAPTPFRNFVAQARQGVSKTEHEAFFRRMLADVEEPTAPYGLLQVHGDGSDILEERLMLERSLSHRIRVQTRALGVSAASLFHFAWGQVLSRLSGLDDVVFGTVLFGRMSGAAGTDRALGLFINTLPVRISLGEIAVAEGIKRTHESLAQLVNHEHASLTLAQRCSGVPAQMPLFSALLNYRHSEMGAAAANGRLEGGEVLSAKSRTNYPCVLSIDDMRSDFALAVQVVKPLSAQNVCRYMQQALSEIVEAMERSPRTPAWRIGVLDEAERHRLLVEWNQTYRFYPPERCVHELFEEQVARTPDAIALEYEEQSLSYGETNARANQLARYLRILGVGPEVRVAILAERSVEMVVSLLATLKAGGAYVPLDPAYPIERLSYMLGDSGAAVLLVHVEVPDVISSLRQSLGMGVLVVDVRANAHRWKPQSSQNLGREPGGSDRLAYVIYTSGSTGEPKGVMVEHRNLCNLIGWHCEAFHLSEGVRSAVAAGVSFDASSWEIWPGCCSGGTLVLAPSRLSEDPAELLKWWQGQSLDVSFLVTPLAELACSEGRINADLQYLLVGGDRLSRLPVRPGLTVVNNYGPTETTVVASSGRLSDKEAVLHIGRPIANTRIYILDRHRQPVPVGVAGEIYIGGAGVARGYLNRPELTAQRFVRDPFSAESEARMYRTGDLGRFLPDGNIEYLGRNDAQVKIRGYRIELGEIEAHLRTQSGVREAVIALREDAPGEKRLVAYVVSEDQSLDVMQLREQLLRELPEYMVPAAYVQLETLPLTPNGKLDRRALPAPDGSAFAQHAYEAPYGELESVLAQIWSELLGVERVGRQDHFFELGGHSLMAVRLLERMRQQNLYTDIRALFTQPTLLGFAQAVREAQQSGWREVEVPPNAIEIGCEQITPSMLPLIDLTQQHIDQIVSRVPGGISNIQDIYPLAPLQEGILFHHLLQQEGDAYQVVSTLSFDSRARLDGFVQALQSVIDRHDILRTAVLWEGLPEAVQVVWRQASIEVQMLTLQGVDIREQLERHSDPAHYRLDIRQAPLLKGFAAFDERADRWLLRVVWHHLIFDHSALEVLAQEVRLIQAGRQQLLSPPMPFRNFVALARHGASKAEHETFFRQMLADVEEPTAPYGLLQVHGDGTDILEQKQLLERSFSQRLRMQARALGVSAASLFHFAWGQVLSRLSGLDDVVFGTVLFGRMHGGAGADRALGLFMNTLPLRISLGEIAVAEGIKRTHESLAQLVSHEHASLALAQRCSGVPAQVPLFSALLNYRHSQSVAAAASEDVAGMEVLSSQERTNYPCMLSVDDLGRDFALTVQVVKPLSAQSVCRYMQQALSEMVEALERSPQTPAWLIGVLDETERHRLLVEWNQTQKSYPQDRCVHELFEEQVARTPEAIAVVHAGQCLTYAELNARSNQLARYLRDKAVGPNHRVAICVERGLELIVGLFGILKAGGAYVPLDPAYPPERLAYMLQDAAPNVLLTQERLKASLPSTTAEMVALDDWNAIATRETTNLPRESPQSTASNLAYLIYTSGSTGKPKAVMVEHAGVVNCLRAMQEHLKVSASDCLLAVTTIAFDTAGVEIYLPLFEGAKIIVASRDAASDPQQLTTILEGLDVTFMQATPTAWQLLLSAGWKGRSSLTALCGGEALRTDLSRDLLNRVGALWNLYGPTEVSIWSSMRQITAASEPGRVEPIGQAIANMRVYILDSRMRLAPIGVTGEIYIAGASVARGYLNQSALTMQRFVDDCFSDDASARMYKTGDLGQWRADGTIEFVGRNDHQVKIRGFRIELGEIETQIARCAQVTGAIVMAREDDQGEKQLVAYITQADHDSPSVNDLRAQLKSVLPEYMVPSAFVKLENFPLTPNGKLDRRALPAPDGQAYATRKYEAPVGDVEATVAQIWSELLKVERIGRHDNFFELGGHSLTDLKLVTKIAQKFAVQMQVQAVYRRPTVQEMAELIEELLPANRMSLASGESELEEYVL